MRPSTPHLPPGPLLSAYLRDGLASTGDLGRLPVLGPRFAAVLAASARFLFDDFLDRAAPADFADAVGRFYEAVVSPPLHLDELRQRAGIVRHGAAFLLRGAAPPAEKMAACLTPAGPYFVAGLGPSFWSALLQATRPSRLPGWTATTLAGARRLGLARLRDGARPEEVYAALQAAHAHLRRLEPRLDAPHIDHFLTLAATAEGRSLDRAAPACPIAAAAARERAARPLRDRLKERGAALADGQRLLEEGLARQDGKLLGDALAAADPAGAAGCPLDWGRHAEDLALWAGRLWEADDPYPVLDAFWRAEALPVGPWLPAAVLHLRDPQRFVPYPDAVRRGHALLDDAAALPASPAERYRLANAAAVWLRQRHGLHPLEAPAVLAGLGEPLARPGPAAPPDRFGGFCSDTFRFLADLAEHNNKGWLRGQRDRYRFAVRAPLAELCRALDARYVGPVLRGLHGLALDGTARPGRALTRLGRNAFGRGAPYNTVLWVVFGRRSAAGAREGPQLFVRLDAAGLRFGLRLGRRCRDALRRLRGNIAAHGARLCRALAGAFDACRFGDAEAGPPTHRLDTAEDLAAWSRLRSLEASVSLAPDDPLLTRDELAGAVLLTFDRLLPLFVCAAEEDAGPFLAGRVGEASAYGEGDFLRATFLRPDWLRRARDLLGLKRQLLLQGVPGTGKTHVARCLARLLTGGRDGGVRLVQFHPAYTYEELVEGVKVRSVETEGRHDVTYPIEDGVLCAFAAEAGRRPAEPFVLVIDEINRGNLPRLFGELLYLLEYRGQEVVLPYSRRPFRLPENLYLLGTLNAADRSVALIDQALRRRFSFLEMPPDAGVLAGWLEARPPAAGPAFAARVLRLFEALNDRLRAEAGPQAQVGHSFFMVEGLDEARLRLVWEHHVRPLLEEHLLGRPGRLADFTVEALLGEGPRRRPARGATRG
jgi:MoxR-like ATPase